MIGNWTQEERITEPPKLAVFERSDRRRLIMFPAHHDIHSGNVALCTAIAGRLLKAGHSLLIVSKPDPAVITTLIRGLDPAECWGRVEFRFTIGSVIGENLAYWEPGAPRLGARLESLIIARQHRIRTSVSIEPMLDIVPERLVEVVRPLCTESIWIGLPNFLPQRLAINGEPGNVRRMGKELMDLFTDDVVRRIYNNLKDDPMIRWKDSMKKRIGLELETKSPSAYAPCLGRNKGFGKPKKAA